MTTLGGLLRACFYLFRRRRRGRACRQAHSQRVVNTALPRTSINQVVIVRLWGEAVYAFTTAALVELSLRRALYAQQREEGEKIFLLLGMRSEERFSEQIV